MTAMSVQSTADVGRSILGEVLHWALPRLAGYVLAALAAVFAFTIWAVVYTYVWPGKPPPIETPQPASIVTPAEPTLPSTPIDDNPAIARVPSDALPVTRLKNLMVYDLSNEKVGKIEDVLLNHDGKIVVFIVGVGDWVVGSQGKNIAVPFDAVKFETLPVVPTRPAVSPIKTGDFNGQTKPVLHMSKDAMLKAPRQKFDPTTMTWVPDPAR